MPIDKAALQHQSKTPYRGRRRSFAPRVPSFPNRGIISGHKRSLGADATTIANNASAIAAFYAAQTTGTTNMVATIQAAQAAVASIETDIVAANMGSSDPGTIVAAKGFTKLQAGLGVAVAIIAGFAIGKALK